MSKVLLERRMPQVQGDAFLARIFDSEVDFERLDFNLKEVTSSATWVKEAAAQNEAKRRGDSAASVFQRMQASPSMNISHAFEEDEKQGWTICCCQGESFTAPRSTHQKLHHT
jgi:hypothetical protein